MTKSLWHTLIVAITMLGINQSVWAQSPSYKNFEWEILRVGYGNISTSNIKSNGFTLGGELRYNLTDYYSIGIGGEAIFALSNVNNDNADIEVLLNTSISIDRYFDNSSGTRPFVGMSIGTYRSFNQMVRNGEDLDPFNEHSSFGFAPRIGYEIGHLRLLAQYQFSTSDQVHNGFTMTAGITLWGGYKNKEK